MYDGPHVRDAGLQAADIPKYFKDASFGVPAGGASATTRRARTSRSCATRRSASRTSTARRATGAMFGLGYVGAEDRLFFMDVLRHAGRGELSSFAGGSNADGRRAVGGRARTPRPTSTSRPRPAEVPRRAGQQIARDVDNYIAGINQYIAEAKLDPTQMPGEYAAIGRPRARPVQAADLIATASLVGGIFGKGGGEELEFSQLADALRARFGRKLGDKVFRDFRSAEDPRRRSPSSASASPTRCRRKAPRGVRATRIAGSLQARRRRGRPAGLARGSPPRVQRAAGLRRESESGHR
jgi:hypothetical protein